MRKLIVLFVFCAITPAAISQQNFSCSYGTRAACLGYGDKVVDQNSVCFSSSTCGYQGFVCKSKLDDLAGEYDTLANSYNDLLRKHKSLITTAQDLQEKNNSLISDYNDLLEKAKRLSSDYDDRVAELRALTNNYNQLVSELRTAKSRNNETNSKKIK